MKQLFRAMLVFPLFALSAAVSAVPVLSFTGGSPLTGGGTQNIGWQFDVLSNTTVTHLSWADLELDGLNNAHEVGIWNAAGTLLTSATIQAGTGSTLNGIWRTEDIADILLTAGTGYIVGGLSVHPNPDAFASNVSSLTVNPSISFVDATFSSFTSTFGRPTLFSTADTGFFGPSFDVAAVPEPASLSLLGLGLVGLLLSRSRARG